MSARCSLETIKVTLEDGRRVSTPWWRVDSGREGPNLLVVAAQHGNEVQGAEVIRRFASICRDELVAGSAMLVPMMNLLAIEHRRNSVRIGPEEKDTDLHRANNMNRKWPGDRRGDDIDRVVYALHETVVTRATHLVDLHCWCRIWAAAALGCDVGESRTMAEATGMRFIIWSEPEEEVSLPTQLRKYIVARGGAGLTIEFSGQFCVDELQVLGGVRSLVNVAKLLGMIEGDPEMPADSGIAVTSENTTLIEAPCSGLFVQAPGLRLEDPIEAGQKLGHILRDDDLSTVEIEAPVSGWLWRYGRHGSAPDVKLPDQHPYADHGDPLAAIVSNEEAL